MVDNETDKELKMQVGDSTKRKNSNRAKERQTMGKKTDKQWT
jgi:hypothetical protein